jgi:hypothetical protein
MAFLSSISKMKSPPMRKLFTWFCLTLMVLFMASIFVQVFTRYILIKKLHIQNSVTRLIFNPPQNSDVPVTINWAKLYPFQAATQIEAASNILETIQAKIAGIEEIIESYTKGRLINRML